MARRSSSLGPFPKTHRWGEILEMVSGTSDAALADRIISNVRKQLAGFGAEPTAIHIVTFFAALPIVTRFDNPAKEFESLFGIRFRGSLRETLASLTSADGVLRRASLKAFDAFTASPLFRQSQIGNDEWSVWRTIDGSPFCDLARTFYAHLCEELLAYHLKSSGYGPEQINAELARHAWELSRITQAFSARWFNACALDSTPDRGNVSWYLRHCLGKLDMELERELSSHVEPPPSASRRRKKEPPSLGLPFGEETIACLEGA